MDFVEHLRLKALHPHIEAGLGAQESAAENQELRNCHHGRAGNLAIGLDEEEAHHADDCAGTEAGNGHSALQAGKLVFPLRGHDLTDNNDAGELVFGGGRLVGSAVLGNGQHAVLERGRVVLAPELAVQALIVDDGHVETYAGREVGQGHLNGIALAVEGERAGAHHQHQPAAGLDGPYLQIAGCTFGNHRHIGLALGKVHRPGNHRGNEHGAELNLVGPEGFVFGHLRNVDGVLVGYPALGDGDVLRAIGYGGDKGGGPAALVERKVRNRQNHPADAQVCCVGRIHRELAGKDQEVLRMELLNLYAGRGKPEIGSSNREHNLLD